MQMLTQRKQLCYIEIEPKRIEGRFIKKEKRGILGTDEVMSQHQLQKA